MNKAKLVQALTVSFPLILVGLDCAIARNTAPESDWQVVAKKDNKGCFAALKVDGGRFYFEPDFSKGEREALILSRNEWNFEKKVVKAELRIDAQTSFLLPAIMNRKSFILVFPKKDDEKSKTIHDSLINSEGNLIEIKSSDLTKNISIPIGKFSDMYLAVLYCKKRVLEKDRKSLAEERSKKEEELSKKEEELKILKRKGQVEVEGICRQSVDVVTWLMVLSTDISPRDRKPFDDSISNFRTNCQWKEIGDGIYAHFIDKDNVTASKLLSKSCSMKQIYGCHFVAMLAVYGYHTSMNAGRGIDNLRNLCAKKVDISCQFLEHVVDKKKKNS